MTATTAEQVLLILRRWRRGEISTHEALSQVEGVYTDQGVRT